MGSMLNLPRDFVELLTEFAAADVRYLVISGYAVGFHDRPRATKDIDLLLADTPDNIARAGRALTAFGAPRNIVDALQGAAFDDVVWFGIPPGRVDLLKSAGGVDFDNAYQRRIVMTLEGVDVSVVSIEDLLAMKRAADRDQDRVDIARLERVLQRGK
jgi:hypothetical protein